MLNFVTEHDAGVQAATTARMSSGQGAILPAAAATRQPCTESIMIFARLRGSWQAGLAEQPGLWRTAVNPVLTGLDDLGNQVIPAAAHDPYPQCKPGNQFPYTTRFVAPSGDVEGSHPAREPV
jgi:hypothetical protein